MLTLSWEAGGYFQVDPSDASTTELGTSTLLSSTRFAVVVDGEANDQRIGALAFDPDSGTLYGLGYDNNLYTIDPATAEAAVVTPAFTG